MARFSLSVLPMRALAAPRRMAAAVAAAAMVGLCLAPLLQAAELRVDDGVVIKFGQGAQLVVRDRLVMGSGVTLTSVRDDAEGGPAGASAQVPAAGDWGGMRIEKSAASGGAPALDGVVFKYAGAAQGADVAALTLRAASPALDYLQFFSNSVGLRLLDGASPAIQGASFLGNATGLQASGASAPVVRQSQFEGNSAFAIVNHTPHSAIQARGNWWGHASGPLEPGANPQGQGDKVSPGVDFSDPAATAPLLNPTVRLAAPAAYYAQRTVVLDLSCINASEFRIAEGGRFAGQSFQPLANGRAQQAFKQAFTVSPGDGVKQISVQYRHASGTLATAQLDGGLRIDTLAPDVSVVHPAPGSIIRQPITVQAQASDAAGIAQLRFFLDGQLVATRTSAPYTFDWDTQDSAEGPHTLQAIATDGVGRTAESTVEVTLSRAPAQADTTGPVLGAIQWNGTALADGMELADSGRLTLTATDPSGVAQVELLIDGAVAALATLSSGAGASYGATLSLQALASGSHALEIRAADSLGNLSTQAYAFTLAHAPPPVPVLHQPADGSTTRLAEISVAGSAPSARTVQLLLNGSPAGAPVAVSADGRFAGVLALVPGVNRIQASATHANGSSAPSAPVSVTLDLAVPAAMGGLSALPQSAGRVRLAWARSTDPQVTGYHIYRAAAPFESVGEALRITASALGAAVTGHEDLPPQDGLWTYRVVAVNAAGTLSSPSNAAQAASDGTAPRALSIAYTSQGQVDPASGRMGQGRVSVVLTVSEALQAPPYLALVPQGGAPLTVELARQDETTYAGSFLIGAGTPAGTAHALFSARDRVGNRGTDIDAGAQLPIDTQGPVLSRIDLEPAAPIHNAPAQTVTGRFTFSKPPVGMPQIRYLLSGAQRSAEPLAGLVQTGPASYEGRFTLPGDGGQGRPESLSFSHQSADDLGNQSSRIAAPNRFQVYQGALPPLDAPVGLTARAQPGGKARLSWQAVDQAFAYQIYRQDPGQTALEPLERVGGTEHIDQTTADGLYRYAVATVRRSNGEESVSGHSAAVEVRTASAAPGAPQDLRLTLTGQGIHAAWQPPLASEVDHYRLYRAEGTRITAIDALTPYKTRIRQTQTYDTEPSPTQGAYVVTAVDAVGNESAISNSAYLNASLLPVRNLRVAQIDDELPVIQWDAPHGNLAGYLVYLGAPGSQTRLTAQPITDTRVTDTGYTTGERLYSVAAVDANGVEMPRSIALPGMAAQIVSGLPIQRGIFNRLQVQVTNLSARPLEGVKAVVRLPTDRQATQFRDHASAALSLAPNETRLVPVIVGGYADMPSAAQAQVGVEIAPLDGEQVRISRRQAVTATEGALFVGMSTEQFTRGATGRLQLTIENTSEVDIELLTATGHGANPSSELRFKILDADGNVLATQPYHQALGAEVVTLANGLTVARIPAASRYVSEVFLLNVPQASPDSVRVQLEVDALRYRTGQDDEVRIAGRGSERTVSLAQTVYYGEITDINPLSSFGDQDIVITGRAVNRAGDTPAPGARLELVLNQQGFERAFGVLADGTGAFRHVFTPTLTDAGLYQVSAVHPSVTDRPAQKSFTIQRVVVGPSPYRLDLPRNYPFTMDFSAQAGAGTTATGLRLVLDAASQPTGQLPQGIALQLPAPVDLGERQRMNLPVVFTASNEALPSGSVIFDVVSNESAGTPIGQLRADYQLSEARPFLVSTPSYVETGMARGGSQIESVQVSNNGLQDALELRFTLALPGGGAAPPWAGIGSRSDGTLAVGQSRAIDLHFTPPASTPEGVYEFRLNVEGGNLPAQSLNVYVNLTQSGQGGVLFKAADIYTATIGKGGQRIAGLADASITVQNEDVPTITREMRTDSLGEALFQDLPAGRYKYRARAANHQEVGGRVVIKPAITVNQPLFLDYNLITVEWSVREITIEDRYDVTLNATFEADVPAAVVVLQPASINLPRMAVGDVHYGELQLTNFGLVRADNLQQQLPQSDSYFRYEFLTDPPTFLDARQRVTLPYRVVALQSLEGSAASADASGGGCYSYSNNYSVRCDFACANGTRSVCGSSATWFAVSNSSCSGSSSGSGGVGGGASGGWNAGIGGFGGAGTSTPLKMKGKKCVFIPKGGMQCEP